MTGLPEHLPDAARRYCDALPEGRLFGACLTPLDVTGVPVWKVVFLLDKPPEPLPPVFTGCGYGMTDDEAIIGAFGEVAEMVFAYLMGARLEKIMGTYSELVVQRGERHIVDPLTACLPAGSPVDRDTPLAWVPAQRVSTGEGVLVPVDIALTSRLGLPPNYRPFTTLIQHGLGAGPDFDWALSHGLFELLQRDGNGLLFRALDHGVVLDLPSDLDEETQALLERLDRLGIDVRPKFATDEFGFSNLYVVGAERETTAPVQSPVLLAGCGEACDPDPRRALRKALLEYCSSRVRKLFNHGPLESVERVVPTGYMENVLPHIAANIAQEEGRATTAMVEWMELDEAEIRRRLAPVLAQHSRVSFAKLPANDLNSDRGKLVRTRLDDAGLDVLAVDFSPAADISVVKAIVPGLEVETLSYYRVGERNVRKLMAADSPLLSFGRPDERLQPVRLTPEAHARLESGTPLLDCNEVDRVVAPLYALYREPEMHVVALRNAAGASASKEAAA